MSIASRVRCQSVVGRQRLHEILQLRAQGLTLREIGQRYGITRQRVSQIVNSSPSRRPSRLSAWAAERGREIGRAIREGKL